MGQLRPVHATGRSVRTHNRLAYFHTTYYLKEINVPGKSNSRKVTQSKPASQAGKLLNNPKTPKIVKTVAGSALAQTPNKRGKK